MVIAFDYHEGSKARSFGADFDISPTVIRGHVPAAVYGGGCLMAWIVRRLTPRECERLQGFPDDYTMIENASDTARYKALGNSMAVPVMRWIGERLDEVNSRVAGLGEGGLAGDNPAR
ncbi:MAG: DNA cytosine methyltransferase [Atopobiaceae bacterium]|nr:DNA cytosine methyltransferase [Atopobiaceae bacterium]